VDTNNQTVELKDLDIFDLLRLEHLSTEEKAQRIAEMQEIALADFFAEDLPALLPEEDLKAFESMANDPSKAEEIKQFLTSKIPDFDKIIFDKMLVMKKELVKQNMLTRMDINKKESSDSEVQKDENRMQELAKEKSTLENILAAIDKDEWSTASELISSL
jgi:hypothetical protein